MAVTTFIPEVWAAELFTTLEKSYVLSSPGVTVNTDYEGDIANFGDTVHIGSLTDPSIADYAKGSTTINPQQLTTADQTLVINQAKYFAFEVDDVDARQVRDNGLLLTRAAQRAAEGLKDAADTYVGDLMAANAGNVIAAASVNSTDGAAYKVVVNLRNRLDKANVPQSGRFVVVGPDFYALLLQDGRFIDASRYGAGTPIVSGEVGTVLGMRVLVSTNVPAGAGVSPNFSEFVLAGHPIATTWAEQINKVEAYRPESSFSDAIKGLHLYGAKVVRPEALVVQDLTITL